MCAGSEDLGCGRAVYRTSPGTLVAVLLIGLFIYFAAEVAAFVAVAEQIGVLLAVLLVVLISAAGPLLVRRAGLGVLHHARVRLARGESPNRDLLDGVVVVLGGVLVCIPGFVGDVLGLLLLVRPIRHLLIHLSGKALARHLDHSLVVRVSHRSGAGEPVIDTASREIPPQRGEGR